MLTVKIIATSEIKTDLLPYDYVSFASLLYAPLPQETGSVDKDNNYYLSDLFNNFLPNSRRIFRAIRDTQKVGATHCILGKSSFRAQIYCVCMGI